MKNNIICIIISLCFISIFSDTAFATDRNKWLSMDSDEETTHKISIGGTWHSNYSNFDKMPIEEDDYSYLLFYELHNKFAYWQLGGSFTPGPDDNRFDHIITPQLNLIIKDRIYRIGIGALTSNLKINGDNDWTRVYWQCIVGLGIPLGSHFGIDIYGHYLFESWKKIEKPASAAPGISVMINFAF